VGWTTRLSGRLTCQVRYLKYNSCFSSLDFPFTRKTDVGWRDYSTDIDKAGGPHGWMHVDAFTPFVIRKRMTGYWLLIKVTASSKDLLID
jgi:hypothetical protein